MDFPLLRFGAFLPPLHAPWRNPTLALRRDLELVDSLDQLGFDEVWFGEHHGLGWETSGSPEIMIAAAAERTRSIKLATGVISLPYHHPLIVADRLNLLDHLSGGRLIFGAGPGAFPTDAYTMGIDYMSNRDHMTAKLEAIIELLTSDEPVNRETEWFVLRDSRLNLRPYQRPCFEVVVAAVATATGPKLCGRLGTGLLSLSVNSPEGFDAARNTWAIAEESAAQHNQVIDRKNWRVTQFCHIAETDDQARRNVRYGLIDFLDYMRHLNPASSFHDPALTDIDDIIDDMNAKGTAVIHQSGRLPHNNLELFSNAPITMVEHYRSLGANAAAYALGEMPDPVVVPQRGEAMGSRYHARTAMIYAIETGLTEEGAPPELVEVTFLGTKS